MLSIILNYYPFVISLSKFSGSCSEVHDLSTKICVSDNTKETMLKYLI